MLLIKRGDSGRAIRGAAAVAVINCLLFMDAPPECNAGDDTGARYKIAVYVLILVSINLYIAWELLTAEYINQMGSIESTHIALARYALENWRDLTWFPLWYGGIPYQDTYPPLMPLLLALVARVTGMTPAHAYHSTTAIFYALGPVTLFFFASRISRSSGAGFAASLFYSLISPSAFLISAVRGDGGLLHPRRFQALAQYGEGPHITSLTLVPLALLIFGTALERRRPFWWVLAACALAAVALTNWPGAFVLAVTVILWLLAMPDRTWRRTWLAVVALGVGAYALAIPWLPPSTVVTVFHGEGYASAPTASISLRVSVLLGFAGVVTLLLRLFRHYRTPRYLRFSILFLLAMAVLTLAAQWFGVLLMPQAGRYHLAMEMAIALVVVFALKPVFERRSPRFRVIAVSLLIVLCIVPARRDRRYARWIARHLDVRSTIEYREAQWFREHMDGHRVFAPGSAGFFLNVFTDVPQYAGGFDQGNINPVFPGFHYQILSSDGAGTQDGVLAVLALQAVGVDAIGVSGPHSQEAFKPFRNPAKFDGLLPVVWREGDDVIYRIPRRSASLAHVVRPADLPVRQPANGIDLDPLRPYVRALEDRSLPTAEFVWRNRHSAVLSATMRTGQVLSVQINYHPGWSAAVNGRQRRLCSDHLGQIVVDPECDGPCTVELRYDGGREMRAALWISWGAALAGLAWVLLSLRQTHLGTMDHAVTHEHR